MPSAEIEAMGAIEDAFVPLDDDTRARVLAWAYAKYASASELTGRSAQQRQSEAEAEPAVIMGELEQEPEAPAIDRFQHFAELYAHCNPSSRAERFLVAAYWLQVKAAKESFGNREINVLLKDQGHEDASLNKIVDSFRNKTPKFIIQLGGGAADKSRRVLKLSQPGLKAVEDMVRNAG
ncbi:actin-related protein [Paenarthrobacter nicotinovorans]|uniref:hypothetical protein n=1 Tax=Micrococcaceae TaxID=1268 RepID=UPI000875FE60|nr:MULTISPECIES: hypothetical protein [Micrococcaceae]MDR6436049.1 actin-related protein [Paenarthrobacter nicotinovorans]SCZ51467.1 hypothetical protein SAMN02799638_00916 [Arthrobacter sp. UNCCL28]